MPPLFIITGLSGAGKTTVADALMLNPSLSLSRFVTTTTRAMRPGEENGKQYWFITREEFQQKRDQGGFYEWADVYGNFYGPSKAEMERLSSLNKPILLVMDVQGANTLKTIHPDANVIFFDAPNEDLLRRLHERGSTEEEIEKRRAKEQEEREYKHIASLIINNKDGELEHTLQHVIEYIQSHLKT
jgi:guanylate kinase